MKFKIRINDVIPSICIRAVDRWTPPHPKFERKIFDNDNNHLSQSFEVLVIILSFLKIIVNQKDEIEL